jgi:hypothetical protein
LRCSSVISQIGTLHQLALADDSGAAVEAERMDEVGRALRLPQHEIGPETRRKPAAVGKAERAGGIDGDAPQRLLGDRCTFEVLLQRAGLHDDALAAIGEIIHDIDLKDGKYGREETAGIRIVMAGIATGKRDDEERLARGGAVLDDLYESLKTQIAEKAK